MLVYFMALWNILQALGIFYDHLVQFVVHLVHFSGFSIMYQEKSGNPVSEPTCVNATFVLASTYNNTNYRYILRPLLVRILGIGPQKILRKNGAPPTVTRLDDIF
jgi:hypothetical protein